MLHTSIFTNGTYGTCGPNIHLHGYCGVVRSIIDAQNLIIISMQHMYTKYSLYRESTILLREGNFFWETLLALGLNLDIL